MEYCAFRAPIDNDRYIVEQWRAAGYDRIRPRVYSCNIQDNIICLKLSLAAAAVRPVMILDLQWTVGVNGMLHCRIDAFRGEKMPWLPRFGLVLPLTEDQNRVLYYGVGPEESYVDSHHASWLSAFETTARNMGYSYLRPQEAGNRWNCWDVKVGEIRVVSETPFSFKASPYSIAQLTEIKHNYELPQSEAVYFHIDYKMSGLGSASCGPELQKKYRLDEDNFHWEFVIQ